MWIRRLSELALAVGIGLLAIPASAAPPANDDPFSDYRERFKQGLDRYQAGAFTEAVGYWEPIYGELGEQRGYRLAYNLGVAYQELGDATRGAERLQSFLAQAEAKRGRGESQPAIVQKEENDAKARLSALTAAKGRIHVDPGTPPRAIQVDAMAPRVEAFVAWVNPGQHSVTFASGTPGAETRTLEVHAGELIEVAPSPPPAPPPAPAPTPAPAPAGSPQASAPVAPSAGDAGSMHHETVHPFPPALLYISGGLTLIAGVASIPLEASAWSQRNHDLNESPVPPGDSASFYTARSWAYGMIGTTAGLALVTAGLATWYFAGTSEREIFVTPGGVAGRF
jgi:hypothetical protein